MEDEKEVKYKIKPSTIEDVDKAIYYYLNEKLNLHTDTNKGFKKVPVIWVGAERSYQIKHDVDLRNKSGLLHLPLMSVERISITKDPTKGPVPSNIPDIGDGGSVIIAREQNIEKTADIRRSEASRKSGVDRNVGSSQTTGRTKPKKVARMFDTASRIPDKIVYKTYYAPIPVYITVKYEITIRTEYQQQMNDLMTPFISGFSPIGRNHRYFFVYSDGSEGHKYEAFIDHNYTSSNNIGTLNEEERKFESKISIEVLGYLIGADKNEDSNVVKVVENAVVVRIPRERVVMGDSFERINKKGTNPFYKE